VVGDGGGWIGTIAQPRFQPWFRLSRERPRKVIEQWEATPVTAITAEWVPMTQLDQASSNGGGREERPNSGSENRNPSFNPTCPFNPYYVSFSLDWGGWSLNPKLIIISKFLTLDYMLEYLHVDLWNWLYIYGSELSKNWVLKVLIEPLGWLNIIEVTFGMVLWKGSLELSECMCTMAVHALICGIWVDFVPRWERERRLLMGWVWYMTYGHKYINV